VVRKVLDFTSLNGKILEDQNTLEDGASNKYHGFHNRWMQSLVGGVYLVQVSGIQSSAKNIFNV
jgi:hypothetical protein